MSVLLCPNLVRKHIRIDAQVILHQGVEEEDVVSVGDVDIGIL